MYKTTVRELIDFLYQSADGDAIILYDTISVFEEDANDFNDITSNEMGWEKEDFILTDDDEELEPDVDECGFNPYEGCYDFDC